MEGDDPWSAAMRRGDFAAAWAVSDAVLRARASAGETCHHWPRHLQYVWRGAPIDGRRLLVRCYHGLGDTIQFVRFAPQLRARAAAVVLWAQPALCSLVARIAGVDRVLPLHDGSPDAPYDVDIEIMEAPHVLGTHLRSLPRTIPYVFPRPAEPVVPAAGRLRVGLAWRSGDWDARRSLPRAALAPLLAIPGIDFLSLQRCGTGTATPPAGASDFSAPDIETLAARLSTLDLVITVDGMIAHLAGALGVRTWVLLHAACDWRWMTARDDSPWYPTMRLFRQRNPGDWDYPVARAAESLVQEQSSLTPH